MHIAALYTQGSNRIKVDVYADGLDMSGAGACCTIVSSVNGNVQNSVPLFPDDFNDRTAHVVLNGMQFRHDRYVITALGPSGEVLDRKAPMENEVPVSRNDSPRYDDKLNDLTRNLTIEATEQPEVRIEPVIHSEMVRIDLDSPSPVKRGSPAIRYSGGGNRYLSTEDGSLVLQKNRADSLDSDWSPLSLGATWKAEGACTNLFTGFASNSSGKEPVQTGIYAYRFPSFQNFDGSADLWGTARPRTELYVDLDPVDLSGMTKYCLSFLGMAKKPAQARLYRVVEVEEGGRTVPKEVPVAEGYNESWIEPGSEILSVSTEGSEAVFDDSDDPEMVEGDTASVEGVAIDDGSEASSCLVGDMYDMVRFCFSFGEDMPGTKLRVRLECSGNEPNVLSVLMPQIEAGEYPTSRILPGATRDRDEIAVDPGNVECETYGYLELHTTLARKKVRSEGSCMAEWVTADGNGLRIMQDDDGSIVACLYAEGSDTPDRVSSTPMQELEEGQELSVRAEWDLHAKTLKLRVGEDWFVTEGVVASRMECGGEIKAGWSECLEAFDGDINGIAVGK